MNGKQEAVKTYIEQTKLLVTLASGFLLAPAAAVSFFHSSSAQAPTHPSIRLFAAAEILLVLSVLFGYAVLASIAGAQHREEFNVYRPATRLFSLFQILLYIGGLVCFVVLVYRVVS
jgi:hypothetical protein